MKITRSVLFGIVLAAGMATPASAALAIVDTEPGAYIDISATGAVLPLSGDLEITRTTTIGNAVFPAGDVVIGNNGALGFGTLPDSDLAPENEPLPSTSAFGGGQCLAGFWDDIGNTVGMVLWDELPDRLIVQFDAKPLAGSTDTVTFQIQIFDGVARAPVYAQIIYADVQQPRPGGGASATIGYQNGGAGFNDVQWSYNTPGAVSNGQVLSLVPEPTSAAILALAALFVRRLR